MSPSFGGDPLLVARLQAVQELYLEDKLDGAMQVALDAFETTGWPEGEWTEFYNILSCEKDARDAAALHRVSEKLSIEYPREAPEAGLATLMESAAQAMERVGDALTVAYSLPVIVTIFLPDAPVDFIVGSYGYAQHKVGLHKICFPYSIIESPRGTIDRALTHELVHVATNDLAGIPVFRWLDEGLATFLADDPDDRNNRFLVKTAAKTGRLLSLRRIDGIFHDSKLHKDDPVQVHAAYALSASFIEYWVNGLGLHSVRDALSRMGSGEDPERAIRHAAGKSLGEMEDEWREHLRQDT